MYNLRGENNKTTHDKAENFFVSILLFLDSNIFFFKVMKQVLQKAPVLAGIHFSKPVPV